MFTGLVETIGSEIVSLLDSNATRLTISSFLAVTALEPLDTSSSGGGGTSLTISDCKEILTDAHLGDSIAVNGTYYYIHSA
jgi:riboflavin synthase alpha subunit